MTLFSTFKGVCPCLETYKSNFSGVNIHMFATGVDKEVSYHKRTELSKQ